jgi:hypothetical protein
LRTNPSLNLVSPKHQWSGPADWSGEAATLPEFHHLRLIEPKFDENTAQADDIIISRRAKLQPTVIVRGKLGGRLVQRTDFAGCRRDERGERFTKLHHQLSVRIASAGVSA